MPILNIPKNYTAGTTPTEQQLDALKEAVEIFFNTTKLGASNLSDGGITEQKIQPLSAISGKFGTATVSTTKLAAAGTSSDDFDTDAVTTAKLSTGLAVSPRNTNYVREAVNCDFVDNSLDGVEALLCSLSITTTGGPVLIVRAPVLEAIGDAPLLIKSEITPWVSNYNVSLKLSLNGTPVAYGSIRGNASGIYDLGMAWFLVPPPGVNTIDFYGNDNVDYINIIGQKLYAIELA